MGLVTKMFSTLFSPNVSQMSAPSLTARDIVSETSSEEVDSAVMGSEKKKKVKGVSALLVPTENIYKKGV